MNFAVQNTEVHNELEALVEKLGYGTLDATFDIHNKKLVTMKLYGKKRLRYAKNNPLALTDLVKRVNKPLEAKDTTKLVFSLEIRNGFIDEVLLVSEMTKRYDMLDKPVDRV